MKKWLYDMDVKEEYSCSIFLLLNVWFGSWEKQCQCTIHLLFERKHAGKDPGKSYTRLVDTPSFQYFQRYRCNGMNLGLFSQLSVC